MRRLIVPIFRIAIVAVLFSVVPQSHAAIQTFEKEYTYTASELDSKSSCRAIALEQVKRLLLQELGVYVESAFIDKSSSEKAKAEVRREITTLSAGVAGTEVVEEKWDGATYWLKARIKADPDDVARRIDELRQDKQKTKELEGVRQRAMELSLGLEQVKADLTATKNAAAKAEQEQRYQQAVQQLSATDWFEKAYAAGEAGDLGGAVEGYTKALAYNPNYAMAYNNRGFAHFRLGEFRQAKKRENGGLNGGQP